MKAPLKNSIITILRNSSKAASSNLSIAVRYQSSKSLKQESFNSDLNKSLKDVDPEIFDIIEHEKQRQFRGIQLIPSENFTSVSVLEALGSVMQNKYSEGYPGQRYYGGNEYIDMAERKCQERALEAFNLDPNEWGVNVQALSGSPANFYVYTALLKPHERIMSLDLPHGGHLSHGYQLPNKKISAVSTYFETFPYRLDESTGLIDYDTMEKNAVLYRPKLVVAGASAYSRLIDYKRIRSICDQHGAYLVADMAHISGLVAAGIIPTPFEYADVVTTTTHKSLRGPRGALIFFRKGKRVIQQGKKTVESTYDLEEKINFAVFPGHQGGPHNHTITALAVALKQANTEEFVQYQKQVLLNCKRMEEKFLEYKYHLVSGGTSNHLLLVDLKDRKIDGARVELVLENVDIAVNKNTVPGDKSALVPGGIRLGTPAMTSRGLVEKDMDLIVEYVHRGIEIALKIKSELKDSKKLKDFKEYVQNNKDAFGMEQLRKEVRELCYSYEPVGFQYESMKYKQETKQ